MCSLVRGPFSVPLRLYSKNRERLCKALRDSAQLPPGCVVLLQAGKDTYGRYDTDAESCAFRQESYFLWAFGVVEPDFYGAICVDSGKTVLFMPRLSEAYRIWMGTIHGPDHVKEKYGVEEVEYVEDMGKTLQSMGAKQLLLLKGYNTDGGKYSVPADFEGIDKFTCNKDILHSVISECRVFKTEEEIAALRKACKISSDAHVQMMKTCKNKDVKWEYQLESTFLHHAHFHGGCRYVGYSCISATGENAAVLHYGHAGAPNDRQIKDGDMCLLDMGAEFFGYTADITTSFPFNGKFTPKQKIVYNAVLDANLSVQRAAKPGVKWVDMHKLAESKILEHLKNAGLLVGDVGEMVEARLGAVFQPHGLGHFLGLDVHDVGGYPSGVSRPEEPGLKNLRTARTLQKDMFITVEPGCYFNNYLIDNALNDSKLSKFMVPKKIDEFRGTGGVRIEDDVLITENGTENFSIVPRTVEEIERTME
jgi:Xaa-Pro dipeptidase